MEMKARFARFGSVAGSFLLAGMLATALAPAPALADEDDAVEALHFAYDNPDLAIGNQDGEYPAGEWVVVDDANGTYVYKDYAHGDNAHYGTYSLYTELTVKDKVLTGINLYSGVDTFFGKWGTYSPHSKEWTINGHLPQGVSLDTVTTKNDDGSITVKPVLKGADDLGYKVKGIYLESVTADGPAADTYAQQTTSVNRRTGKETTSASSTSSFLVTADNASDYCDYNADEGTITLPAKVKNVTVQDNALVYGEGENEYVDNPTNLVRIVYTIGEYAPFTCYAMVYGEEEDPDADAYLGSIVPTDYSDAVAVDGMGLTNRDRWAKTMLSETAQRWLNSWNAGLVDSSLANEGDLTGEVFDLDTISGATKTSEPFIAALQSAAYDNGFFTSISDDLVLSIDGGAEDGYEIDRDSFTDQTTVSQNEDGQYVMNLDFFRSESVGSHGIVPNTLAFYALGDEKVGPQGMLDLQRQNTSYEAVYTVSGADIKSSFENEYVAWDADNYTITVLDPNITHVRAVYTLGHSDSRHAYDLAQMTTANKINAMEEDGDLVSLWESLSNDAKGFVNATAYAAVKDAYQAADDAKADFDLANATISVAKASAYTGKAQKPAVSVSSKSGKKLAEKTDYTVKYANNTNAGTATVTVSGAGDYTGTKDATFTIAKAKNTLSVKAKSVSAKAKKKTTIKANKAFTVKGAQGTVTYKKANKAGKSKIVVAKNGKITVKKGLKKGTYKVKVKVTAAGNANYDKATKTVTVKVKVK